MVPWFYDKESSDGTEALKLAKLSRNFSHLADMPGLQDLQLSRLEKTRVNVCFKSLKAVSVHHYIIIVDKMNDE